MLYLASDHAGVQLKNIIVDYLRKQNIAYEDLGAMSEDANDDYPDRIVPAAQKVAEDPDHHRGIILGGSGQGEAIVANKIRGIRAVVYYGGAEDIIRLSREHNNANVLSLGARFLTEQQALAAVAQWLHTPFPGDERHVRRIQKIATLENERMLANRL